MTVRDLVVDDIPWAVTTFDVRRGGLRPHAPVFWRPAPDAGRIHGDYLRSLVEQGRAEGWRTDDSVLLAARGRQGWLVDDAAVAGERWDTTGAELWGALATAHPGERVRFVCPAYEEERAAFARRVGLHLVTTWWLVEREDGRPRPGDGTPEEVEIPSGAAVLIDAPPVYAPGGPTLVLHRIDDVAAALPAALRTAADRQCSGLVVDRAADAPDLAPELEEAGLRRQCWFYEGTL